MDLQFSELLEALRKRNEITKAALEYSAFLLRQVREMPPDHRKPMLALLRDLISMAEEQDNSALSEE